MNVDVARNVYNDEYRKKLSYVEFVNYLKQGIDLIIHSATFPSDSESMASIRIANEYRNKLRQTYPLAYEADLSI